jgi:hypothetical protein
MAVLMSEKTVKSTRSNVDAFLIPLCESGEDLPVEEVSNAPVLLMTLLSGVQTARTCMSGALLPTR